MGIAALVAMALTAGLAALTSAPTGYPTLVASETVRVDRTGRPRETRGTVKVAENLTLKAGGAHAAERDESSARPTSR